VKRKGRILGALLLLLGCGKAPAQAELDASFDAPPWDTSAAEPEPRPGMVWIPPGVLLAGTPPDKLPRVADEEMAGEQVVMRGFYADIFPWPNEAGAIPTTNLSQAEGRALCEGQGKRLCTELELERACKGPDNTTYEYGEAYKASVCGTGVARALIPNGFNATCASPFGAHDLHGGVWTWTSSQWKRDSAKPNLVSLRGGNGTVGDLVGRCANGRGARPDLRREDIGVRCCAGEPNSFEVLLQVTRGEPLHWQAPDDRIAPELAKIIPDAVKNAAEGRRAEDQFKIERVWIWHPLGNEELMVGGGCAHPGEHAVCGVVIGRMRFDAAAPLSWVPSDWWQPTLGEADTPRELYLQGGDRNGAFRRKVSYAWGRIAVGEKERKKKRKGFKEPTY
jgi:formylglycine-generating enzyme